MGAASITLPQKLVVDKYIEEAKELLKKGDLVQTSEKLWGHLRSQ